MLKPVVMQPLYQLWSEIESKARPLMKDIIDPNEPPRSLTQKREFLTECYDQMTAALENTRILDPACGSGNFLYMSLRLLKDLENQVNQLFEPLGLPFRDIVTPRQLYGIEKDAFAANLARVVVWIGYLQWRYEHEGRSLHFRHRFSSTHHPRALPNPILKDKNTPDEPDRIICDDAILRYDAEGKPYEPEWPEVDVIVGNPPFLGDKKMRSELGDKYVEDVRALYKGRVPGGADLVLYWYEKARTLIESQKSKHISVSAGLLATQSIRMGANRTVLERIKSTGDIFLAWSDRPWVLEGAAVRISIVGFDDGNRKDYLLDGAPVDHINADLQNTIDATKARQLAENLNLAFIGTQKGGQFDIPNTVAQKLIEANSQNVEVVRQWINADDITSRSKNMWIIDFQDMALEQAQKYVAPFQYVLEKIKPERDTSRDRASRDYWWQHQRSRPALRQAIKHLTRYIASPRVAKHRLFVWTSLSIVPDSRIVAISREDDYFFGVLHSLIHEMWSLRLGSWHGVGNDPTYNAQSCFETFPFPWSPGNEDVNSPAHQAISAAAKQLNEERELWLNPPELMALGAGADSPALRERTLTNLYNALVAHRVDSLPIAMREKGQGGEGKNGERIPKVARDFAPRLAQLHDTLDKAVLAAYGWDDLFERLRTHEGDEELLRRLLVLNLSRANQIPPNPEPASD